MNVIRMLLHAVIHIGDKVLMYTQLAFPGISAMNGMGNSEWMLCLEALREPNTVYSLLLCGILIKLLSGCATIMIYS